MNQPLRVLLVEDEENDALLSLQILRESGYAPSSLRVDTAQALVMALETQPWDVVLCDYALPKYDGEAALVLVHTRKPNLPVIFVTGTLGEEAAVRLVKAGAYDYVLKDRLARLPMAVEQALREAAERRAHEETQRALRDTARQLSGVLEAAADGIFEIDASGTIMLANEAAHRLFGWPSGALLNQPLSTIIPPEHREQHAAGFHRLVQTGVGAVIGQVMEITGLRYDGTRLYCALSWSALTHHNGEQRFVAILQDITARKQAVAALANLQHRTELILTSAGEGIFGLDLEGRVTFANPAIAKMLGLTVKEMIGQPEHPAWHHTRKNGTPYLVEECPILAVLKNGRLCKTDNDVFWRKDGLSLQVEYTCTPIMNHGKILGIVVVCIDVTERKKAKEALWSANEQLTAIILSSPLVITLVDGEDLVRVWNPAAERLFGWTEAEVLGRPLPTIPPEKRDEYEALRRQVLAGQTFASHEVRRQRKNGDAVLMSCSMAPLCNRLGAPSSMLCIGVDITERKLLEVQAQRMDRLVTLGQLLSGIAHELKNPLFIVTGRLQLLKEKLQGQTVPEIKSDVMLIAEAAERMTKVVERFLQLARPVTPTQALVSMEQVVQQTLDFLAHELMKHQITIVRDFAPNLPQILTDPHQIQGVLLNLILNAMQAMAEAHGRGTLTVTTALMPSGPASDSGVLGGLKPQVEVRIRDDGPGIPSKYRAKLFEPFFTTKAPGKGTGLGLWIVRSTVMTLHGTVHCDSEAGHGATFTVRLPVESPEPGAADPSRPAP